MNDQVVLVNLQDEVLGSMDKLAAHRHPAQLHRAVSVWLLRERAGRAEVLFQQRSPQKITGAGQWGNTICGNVWPGESYEACPLRRLQVELGISGKTGETGESGKENGKLEISPLYTFTYRVWCNEEFGEHEMDRVFVGKYDGEVVPNPAEAAGVIWLDIEELKKAVSEVDQRQPLKITAEGTLRLPLDELKKVLPAKLISIGGQTLTITPWTWLMLHDQRLWDGLK